jgi:hypothetical protein
MVGGAVALLAPVVTFSGILPFGPLAEFPDSLFWRETGYPSTPAVFFCRVRLAMVFSPQPKIEIHKEWPPSEYT